MNLNNISLEARTMLAANPWLLPLLVSLNETQRLRNEVSSKLVGVMTSGNVSHHTIAEIIRANSPGISISDYNVMQAIGEIQRAIY